MHFLAVTRDAGRSVVDPQCAVLVHGLFGTALQHALALQAAKGDAHAGEQLLYRERLHQVVVGAGVEGRHLVGVLQARRQHDDRQRRPAPQRTDNVHAVAIW